MAELLAPHPTPLEALRGSIGERFELREIGVRERDRTYYDTFDGLLREAGLVAVHEDGRLALRELRNHRELASLAIGKPSRPLLASELEPGPLREELEAAIGVRALLAQVRVHGRVQAVDVLDDERKTVVRMALEQPSVDDPANGTALGHRVLLTAVRGYERPLHQLRELMHSELGWSEAERPLLDEALLAVGGTPGGVSSRVEVALEPEQRADAAATSVLRRLVEVMQANVQGAIDDLDTEFLHDFRVALRRSRSVVRELRGVFPAHEYDHFRAELRWLQQASGEARDLDVYVLEFAHYRAMVYEPLRPDLTPLLGVLSERRLRARERLVEALRSERATRLLEEWPAFLERLDALPELGRPDAARPIGQLSAERISKVYRRMVRMGRAIDPDSPPEHYHELRKKGKELRYLLELFGTPFHPAEVVRPMIKALKALQDVLGRHQDREVQIAMLRSLAQEIAPLPVGSAALIAMGALVERLGEDERAARDDFAGRFAAFAAGSQRRLVKKTFA